eukprot:4117120-Ditylum_brightwellii.AAC.1
MLRSSQLASARALTKAISGSCIFYVRALRITCYHDMILKLCFPRHRVLFPLEMLLEAQRVQVEERNGRGNGELAVWDGRCVVHTRGVSAGLIT